MSQRTRKTIALVTAGGIMAVAGAAQDDKQPVVKLETSAGDIVIVLEQEKSPVTVKNFLRYAQEGFYSGTIFHRVIPDFMIQGGGHLPSLEEKSQGVHEPIKNEWQNGLKNVRGAIAMARKGGDPDSATCQFFINVVDNPRLDEAQPDGAGYTAFGMVGEGMDVVDRIRNTRTVVHPQYDSRGQPVVPAEPITIKSVTTVQGDAARRAVENADKAWKQALAERDKQRQAADALKKEVLVKLEEVRTKGTRTESGLMTLVLQDGSGDASPKPTDQVTVHYTGWLTDGRKFDSSLDRGQPATFPLNRVIKGWTEGVGLMKAGEKRLLLIPAELGYGAAGRPPVIPPNSELLFEVELIRIN